MNRIVSLGINFLGYYKNTVFFLKYMGEMIRTRVNPWINTLKKALTAMLKEGLTSIAFHILPDKFEELFRIHQYYIFV